MVITTLETIHRLLKAERAEAKEALNRAADERKKALDEKDFADRACEANTPANEEEQRRLDKLFMEACAKVTVAEATKDAAYKRFQSANDALIDFEGYQF